MPKSTAFKLQVLSRSVASRNLPPSQRARHFFQEQLRRGISSELEWRCRLNDQLNREVARAIEKAFEHEQADPWEPQSILAVFETIASPLKALMGHGGPLFQSVGEKGVELFLELRDLVSALNATRAAGPQRQRIAESIVFNIRNGTKENLELRGRAWGDYYSEHLAGREDVIDEMLAFNTAFHDTIQTLVSAGVLILYPDMDGYSIAD